MKPGSVIVDLAAEQGGNCELTQPDEAVNVEGVTIIGYTDLPSRLPSQSSQLYGSNIRNFLDDLCPDKNGEIELDMEDEVIRGSTVIHNGEITWPPPQKEPPPAPAQKTAETEPSTPYRRASQHAEEKVQYRSLRIRTGTRQYRRGWLVCSSFISDALYSFCTGNICRLARDLECHTFTTHTVDECDQCDQWNHYCWCSIGNRSCQSVRQSTGSSVDSYRVNKYFWRFLCYSTNAQDVQKINV